jgi:hypothetical protein
LESLADVLDGKEVQTMIQNMKFHLGIIMAIGALVSPLNAQEQMLERAMLRIEMISRYEEILKNADDEQRKQTAESMITVLFRELKTDFAPKDLDNHALVRIGGQLRTKTATPRDALIYYDEVIGREDKSHRHTALMGRAEVYGLSPMTADIDMAINDYTRVYEESEERAMRELALFRKIELLMKKLEYAKAAEWARIYLDREQTGFLKHSAKVGLLLAESYDKQNRRDEALCAYEEIWSVHMGNIMISAPAYTRWMELMWERNRPEAGNQQADRQIARMQGAAYIQLTSCFKDRLSKEELEAWGRVEKLMKAHEAGPDMEAVRKQVD